MIRLTAAWMGTKETWFIVERTMSYLYDVIMAARARSARGTIANRASFWPSSQISFAALFNLAAVLSISIGLINLFPIPMLDGGHLLYYGIEALRGKPTERKDAGYRVPGGAGTGCCIDGVRNVELISLTLMFSDRQLPVGQGEILGFLDSENIVQQANNRLCCTGTA